MAQSRAINKHNVLKDIPNLPHETLIIHGTTDILVPYQCGLELFKLIPNSTFVKLENVGHLFFVRPDLVRKISFHINNFLGPLELRARL